MQIPRQYLPSKKFQKRLLIAAITLIVAYFIFLYIKTYRTIKNPVITTSTVPVQDLIEKDTDGDGVRDWEEVLWGTNVNATATFGMSDKTYVDNKKSEVASKNQAEVGSAENLNETEKLAREFLSTILTLKESGNLNAFNIANLAQKFSTNIGTETTLENAYAIGDLDIGLDTAVAKKAYYAKFTKSVSVAKKNGMGTELNAIATFFSSDKFDTAPLLKISATYATLTKSLKAMQVPPSATQMHLDLLNESENMSKIFKNIAEINNNAIVGMIAIAQFEANEPKMEATVAQFVAYFKANAIIK